MSLRAGKVAADITRHTGLSFIENAHSPEKYFVSFSSSALHPDKFHAVPRILFPFRTLCGRSMEAGMNRIDDRRRSARAHAVHPGERTGQNESVLDTVFGLAVMALVCAAGITLKVLIWG